MTEIQERLFALRDEKNAAFVARLIPTLERETILGARTPALRKLAKELRGSDAAEAFLRVLPHETFEENGLHAFLLEQIPDFDRCMAETERFLPYVDNWATCDSFSPKVFKKHRPELLEHIRRWLVSERPYTVRFGVGMLMAHFLDEDFMPEALELVSLIESKEYYVNMMRAWFFATALAKQYEATLPYLEEGRLDCWTHNKTIQKAVESYRIGAEQKAKLRALKRK